MALDKFLVANIVRITVVQEHNASCGDKATIIMTVPIIVRIPENNELMDCDTVLEIFSTSLVIRLIMSPCECWSRYLTDIPTILLKRSCLMCLTIL